MRGDEAVVLRAEDERATSRASASMDPTALAIVAFFFGHALIRILGSSNLGLDDDEAVLQAQVWQLVYSDFNPPLFTWLVFALQSLFGRSVALVELLEAALMAGGGILLYRAALPAFRHPAALRAAMAGYGLTAFYGWGVFEELSHSIALIFAIGFTVWALMRTIRRGGTAAFAILGIAIGIGVLSKYLYLLFAAALVTAALRQSEYRSRLLDRRLALSALVALAIVSPHLAGLIGIEGQTGQTAAGLAERVASDVSLPRLLRNLVRSALAFVLPFALYLGLAFFLERRRTKAAVPQPAPAAGDGAFLVVLRDATLIMLGAVLVGVLALGTNAYNARYMIAPLTLAPVLVFAWIDRWQMFPTAAVARFLRIAAITIPIVAAVRAALYFILLAPPICPTRCDSFVDYRAVAEELGPEPGGISVIRTTQSRIGGNLLIRVPNSIVVVAASTPGVEDAIPPLPPRRCSLVWFQTVGSDPPVGVERALARALGRTPEREEIEAVTRIETIAGAWQSRLLAPRSAPPLFGLATLDPASGLCGRRPHAAERTD